MLTGEDFSRVDDTLLDFEPEDSGTSAPLTGISPLTSLPAALAAQNVPATSLTMGPVQHSMTDSSALFKALHPLSQTVTQDILPSGYLPHITPGRQSVAEKMAALSFPQPQRAVSTTEIPQTPRTQLIRSQLEQQNCKKSRISLLSYKQDCRHSFNGPWSRCLTVWLQHKLNLQQLHLQHRHLILCQSHRCLLYCLPKQRNQWTPQQAIGYQKEVKKTLGKTSEAHAYLKFEMTSYGKCQIDI